MMLEEEYSLRWDAPADFAKAFPAALATETDRVIAEFKGRLDPAYKSRATAVVVAGETMVIPQRIHLLSPPKIDRFSGSIEPEIGFCLLTRDCDGFERQRGLRVIVALNRSWSVPYVMLLVGEYVIEILSVIRDNIHHLDRALYKNFIRENPALYDVVKQRIVSYWDVYYRSQYPDRDDYVGFQIINEIESW